jgi:hypothetical protein
LVQPIALNSTTGFKSTDRAQHNNGGRLQYHINI